jgi:hypothetical protein
VDQQS